MMLTTQHIHESSLSDNTLNIRQLTTSIASRKHGLPINNALAVFCGCSLGTSKQCNSLQVRPPQVRPILMLSEPKTNERSLAEIPKSTSDVSHGQWFFCLWHMKNNSYVHSHYSQLLKYIKREDEGQSSLFYYSYHLLDVNQALTMARSKRKSHQTGLKPKHPTHTLVAPEIPYLQPLLS